MKITSTVLLVTLLAGRSAAQAPPSGATSPEALATLVMQKFSSGTPQEFAAIYPDSAGRVFMRDARGTRTTEIAEVVWKTRHRAVLLLGGVVKAATAARGATMGSNETNGARHFSGFYEAVDSNGTWKITHKIPFDSANHIRTQSLHVEIAPATGLERGRHAWSNGWRRAWIRRPIEQRRATGRRHDRRPACRPRVRRGRRVDEDSKEIARVARVVLFYSRQVAVVVRRTRRQQRQRSARFTTPTSGIRSSTI